MATFPLPTLAASVGADGISAPTYAEIYQSLQASFQSIYGSDGYIDADSQDGQLLAVFAKAIYDANSMAIFVYNNYSPSSAQGAGLSSAVKINGIRRQSPSRSTVTVLVVGQIGTQIDGGVVSDANGVNKWDLPASVLIPPAGQVEVTATAQEDGAVEAPAASVTQIVTPILGWQSVTNPAEASPGAAVETDATLRRRQAFSVALPSQTPLQGIQGAVANVAGVSQSVVYENSSSDFDADGLPPHSIAAVVLGGAAQDIADAIRLKKTPGSYTYGDVEVDYANDTGVVEVIRFFVPTSVDVIVEIQVKALSGYTAAIGTQIKQAVADYINALSIGQDVDVGRLYLPAQLFGGPGFETFNINGIEIAADPGPVGPDDVAIAFNSRATCDTADVTLVVT
jgi:uncharacterized phage protein gp47/JayE